MGYFPAATGTYALGTSIGSTDTSILLSSFTVPVTGDTITMALMNTSIAFGTIAPRTSSSELISFTGITQNADGTALLTGVTRGLNRTYPFTEDTDFKLPHSGQSVFILSDAPQVFDQYAALVNDNALTGDNTFSNHSPTIPTELSSEIHRAASIEYANNLVISGAPNASPTVKGIVQEATVTQVNNGSPTGSTGAVLFASPADLAASIYGLQLPTSGQKLGLAGDSGSPGSSNTYVTQAGFQNEAEVFGTTTGCSTTNAYALTLTPALTAYVDGQRFVFKASFATTGSPNTATLNVNGLGAGNLLKNNTQTLLANDILSGQILEVVRGSPSFQVVSPSGNSSSGLYKSGTTTYDLSTASGTQNIAHGLGITPKYIRITTRKQLTGGGTANIADYTPDSVGVYNGTTISEIYNQQDGSNNQQIGQLGNATIITYSVSGGTLVQSAVPTFDSTNIILTWTKVGSPTGILAIFWEAFS